MEESNRKALTEKYIASYHYSRGQRLVAGIVTLIVLIGMITELTFLALSIINHITG